MGEFHVLGGNSYPARPNMGHFVVPALSRAHFYVLVEPATSAADPRSGQVVEMMGRFISQERLSITGALLRALRLTHEEIQRQNRQSIREQKIGVGVICLAWRDGKVYLAQAGSPIAFIRSRGRLRRFSHGREAGPLGLVEELEPAIAGSDLFAGDLALLAFGALGARTDQEVSDSLAATSGEALRSVYGLAAGTPGFCAMLLLAPSTLPEVLNN